MPKVRIHDLRWVAAQMRSRSSEEVTTMTSREADILLLNEIAGVENGAASEVKRMSQDSELNRLAANVLSDMTRAAQRAGTDGMWCFFCGASGVKLDRCSCGLAESFRCGAPGRLLCEPCRDAHRAVAAHLEKLFGTKPIVRVSSLRARYSRELSSAVRAIEGDGVGNPRRLLFWLSQLDDFETDSDRFRADALKAFRKSKFLDFQSLARNLKQQRDESLIRAVIRAGLAR